MKELSVLFSSLADKEGHPKAKRCYGWSHPEGDDNKGERFVAVLEILPVDSAQTAVKISIVSDIKAGKIQDCKKGRQGV